MERIKQFLKLKDNENNKFWFTYLSRCQCRCSLIDAIQWHQVDILLSD